MTGFIRERKDWPTSTPNDEDSFELASLGRAAWRQLPLVAVLAFVGVVIAAAMVVGSVQRFIAVESILLDEERSNLLDQVSALPNSQRSDSAIQSEIEIIKSRVLAAKVVDRLNLAEDPGFLNPPVDMTAVVISRIMGLADPVLDLISPQAPTPAPTPSDAAGDAATEADPLLDFSDLRRERAISIVRSNLFAERAGRSLVIQIGYVGFDAERTAAIVRAYGDAYTRFQLESTTVDARNAGEWIRQRLDVLERQSLDAARAVQEFRAESNLIEVRGDLLSDQQQSEMTSNLINAAADTASVKARLDNFEGLMAETGGDVIAVSALETGTSSEDILQSMRSEYFEISRRQDSIVELYGPDHPRATDLADRAENLRTAIADELNSAIAAIRANYEIAQSREAALRSQLSNLSNMANDETADLGRLRQLEAISQTYAAVYRDYLERYELTTQQQGFPIASVRILTPAEVPRSASSPRKKLMLASGLMLGALLGVAIGALRELRPQPLRTREDVQKRLGLSSAGLIPGWTALSRSARNEDIMDRTLHRISQSIISHCAGNANCVAGIASVTGQSEDWTMIPRLSAILAGHDKSVLIVDLEENGSTDWVRDEVEERDGIGFRSARDTLMHHGAADSEDQYDFVLLLMPPLTHTVPVEPSLSQAYNVSVLMIPWGKVTPDMVAGALRDHQAFASRLATTVLENADLRKARKYMRAGDYEERIIHA